MLKRLLFMMLILMITMPVLGADVWTYKVVETVKSGDTVRMVANFYVNGKLYCGRELTITVSDAKNNSVADLSKKIKAEVAPILNELKEEYAIKEKVAEAAGVEAGAE